MCATGVGPRQHSFVNDWTLQHALGAFPIFAGIAPGRQILSVIMSEGGDGREKTTSFTIECNVA